MFFNFEKFKVYNEFNLFLNNLNGLSEPELNRDRFKQRFINILVGLISLTPKIWIDPNQNLMCSRTPTPRKHRVGVEIWSGVDRLHYWCRSIPIVHKSSDEFLLCFKNYSLTEKFTLFAIKSLMCFKPIFIIFDPLFRLRFILHLGSNLERQIKSQ